MIPRFEPCVRAIAETAVVRAGGDRADAEAIARAGDYLMALHRRMPDYFAVAFHVLTLAFDAAAIPHHGRPFHLLGAAQRLERLTAWEGSRLGFMRSTVIFHTTFAHFSLYSDCHWQETGHASLARA